MMKIRLLTIILVSFGCLTCLSAQTQELADTSLELSGGGGTQWTSFSSNFGTVLCDASCGTCGGGLCAPHTGTWYAWFGGADTLEIGLLTQTFNVASGANGYLHFWLLIPDGGAAIDSISATLDGTQIWYKLGTDTIGFDSIYTGVNIPLGMVSTGSHTLTFRGLESGTAGNGGYNVLIDDITLTTNGTASTETNMIDEGIRMVNDVNNHNLSMYFNFTEAMSLFVSIIDMNGKIVNTKNFEQLKDGEYNFNTSNLSSGIYSVYFRKENNSSIGKKFYIQK